MTEALESHLQRQIEHSRRFFWHRLRWRVLREFLPKDRPFEIVDVGAGAGLLGDFLKRDRPLATYRFVEPIESLREFLCERNGKEADAGEQTQYASADFVALLDVLEHQQEDRDFLRRLVAKMQPGSVLLLTVPALQSLWSPWDEALGHFRRYDKAALLTCSEGLDLTATETSYLFPEMLPLGILRRLRGARGTGKTLSEDAEFPDLPAFINDALYGVGIVSLALRRHWRAGTSLFMAAEVGDHDSRSGATSAS